MTCWSGFFWSSFRCLGISVSHQQSPLALGGRRSGQDTPLKNHTNPPFAADASLVLASFGEFLLQREMMMRRENNYGAVLLWSERKRLGVFCAEKVVFRAFDDDTFREATWKIRQVFHPPFSTLRFPSSQPSWKHLPAEDEKSFEMAGLGIW